MGDDNHSHTRYRVFALEPARDMFRVKFGGNRTPWLFQHEDSNMQGARLSSTLTLQQNLLKAVSARATIICSNYFSTQAQSQESAREFSFLARINGIFLHTDPT